MKKYYIILIAIFFSCSNYLDMVPEKDIVTISSIFTVRSSTYDFYNSCISALKSDLNPGSYQSDPAMIAGGEYAIGSFSRIDDKINDYRYLGETISILDGFQNSYKPYCNLWSMLRLNKNGVGSVYNCIRYCNIFIDNIDKVNDMADSEKQNWKAEIKAVKAYYYFELVRRYGPICLINKNIEISEDIEKMQIPRSPIDDCFAEIVRLFDEAIPFLRSRNNMPYDSKCCFNKEAAAAYKAMALLYAASPLFNGNTDYINFKNRDGVLLFNSKYDPEKWHKAAIAADEAIDLCLDGGIKLESGCSDYMSSKLNQINDILNSVRCYEWNENEWIFVQLADAKNKYNQLVKTRSDFKKLYNGNNYGVLAPNIQTVELFYTEKGLPIDEDPNWDYANRYQMELETSSEYTNIVDLHGKVLKLHLRREPRFYANVASAGTFWWCDNQPILVVPYRGGTFGTELKNFDPVESSQNITGYWVKKFFSFYNSPRSSGIKTFVMMRMADLYLMQAEAWNEYSGPNEKTFNALDVIRKRAGILPVKQAWQNSLNPDKINSKDGLRDIIHQERMIEFVFEGHHFWDLRRWKTPQRLSSPHEGWNVIGQNYDEFYNNNTKPMIVSNKAKFKVPRDYFWPIKSEEIMISNIVQNPGW